MMPDEWNVTESLETEYRQLVHQSSDQSNSSWKEKEKQPWEKEKQPCDKEL